MNRLNHNIACQLLNTFFKAIKIKFYANTHRIPTCNAALFLKIEKSGSADDKVCEIGLAMPGNDLFVKKHNYAFENAVHYATAALYEQIEKIKTRFHY